MSMDSNLGLSEADILLVRSAENLAKHGKRDASFSLLRTLSLEGWGGLLWQMPVPDLPNLSKFLPIMSSIKVQESWTGASGQRLLNQTIAFVQYLLGSPGIKNSELNPIKALDYGCGYGRISRLMLKYLPIESLYGADPWQESLNLAWEAGFKNNYLLIDEVPEKLPFEEAGFSLIWAFSVFTHLSPEIGFRSIRTLARYLKPGGNIVITLRPIEYWDVRTDLSSASLIDLKHSHLTTGQAFLPHTRSPLEKWGIVYGDTSISINQLEKNIGALKVTEVGGSSLDQYQTYVTLGF